MGLFRRNEGPEEWYEGIPESFKTWFWIRLLACGYVIYLGIDLILQWNKKGLAWWYVAIGIGLILIAITLATFDIKNYVKLMRILKAKKAAEAEAEAASQAGEIPPETVYETKSEPGTETDVTADETSATDADVAEKTQTSARMGTVTDGSIRSFATYVVADDEPETEPDDEPEEEPDQETDKTPEEEPDEERRDANA